jgi:hypothetical protein
MRKSLVILLGCSVYLTSCIAYSVGTTARPVPKGEFQPNLAAYFIPGGIDSPGNDAADDSLSYASADFEGRWGLSDRSDLALRAPAGSGIIVTWKRLVNAVNDPDSTAVATVIGGGIVNFGNHAYVEAGLIASGREDDVVPYGGLRAMHVVPISSGAVSDTPTAGVFGGVRFRVGTNFSLSPEVGIYYDESALGLRERDIIVVPSVTFHWN